MLLQDDMFPIVRIRYDLAHPDGLTASLVAFEAQLARARPFVLIGSGANQREQDHAERRELALWMKRHRAALHRFVLALVYVEPDPIERVAAHAGAGPYEKFWGYRMLVAASEDAAHDLATRLLDGERFRALMAIEPDDAAVR